MRVTLAGYTQLNPEEYPGNNSPEILPAAYARISRSEKSIDKLIREAQDDIPAARKSNERIVFGFGHSSIAEHAVFNLSIEGISRLCLEELERHRLVSYTEKSQRYTQAATDFMIPRGDPLLDTYHAEIAELIRGCRDFYQVYQDRGMPEEDARYFLPLCATGQVGVTINAREAEHVIRALLASSFDECVILGTLIRDALTPVVPSLIKYTTPSPSEAIRYAYSAQNITVDQRADWNVTAPVPGRPRSTRNCGYLRTNGMSSLQLYPMLLNCGNALDDLKSLTAHDSLPPIFEHTYAGFEVVMSAAAYAQLKRHRMASIMARPYNPDFGFTYPVPVGDVNRGMKRIREMSEDLFNKTRSPYVLLNGHRRYLYLTMNMRSLYNFMQLRMDEHAQWDIRAFAENMRAALRAWPGINHYGNLAIELFAGRDKFVNNIERKA